MVELDMRMYVTPWPQCPAPGKGSVTSRCGQDGSGIQLSSQNPPWVEILCDQWHQRRWQPWEELYSGRPHSSVQSLSRVQLFVTTWTAARQASLSITNSRSLPKLMSIESVMPSNHLILCRPFSSCPQSFPASGSFPMSQLFASGGQNIGVWTSTSVLPMNTQDWSTSGWTGWISLQSKGLSRVFSNTTVQKHQFFCAQLFL